MLKEKLLQDPQHIINILEFFGFSSIKNNGNEIRCAIEEGRNPSSIVIYIKNNPGLYVHDYGRNLSKDIFDYLTCVREISLSAVFGAVKKELGITNYYAEEAKYKLFGGIFDRVKNRSEEEDCTIYEDSILDKYIRVPNLRFLRDGISLETQEKFGIGFDVESQRITIPIRNDMGELIAVKGRLNDEPDEFTPKYLYLEKGPASKTMYGYCENYKYLLNSDVIIAEAEKSVMQADSMGYHNVVAIGSNGLSVTQAKMLLKLQPKSVSFMLDKSLELENTMRNIKLLRKIGQFCDAPIYFFDWRSCDCINEKDSPFDHGKEVFDKIKNNFMVPESELVMEENVGEKVEDKVRRSTIFDQ